MAVSFTAVPPGWRGETREKNMSVMNIPNNYCQYPNYEHLLSDPAIGAGFLIYQDVKNGIPEMIRCCNYHYKVHILKYWPESSVAVYYRKQDASKSIQASLLTGIGEE
jgi:hypothetical protein